MPDVFREDPNYGLTLQCWFIPCSHHVRGPWDGACRHIGHAFPRSKDMLKRLMLYRREDRRQTTSQLSLVEELLRRVCALVSAK